MYFHTIKKIIFVFIFLSLNFISVHAAKVLTLGDSLTVGMGKSKFGQTLATRGANVQSTYKSQQESFVNNASSGDILNFQLGTNNHGNPVINKVYTDLAEKIISKGGKIIFPVYGGSDNGSDKFALELFTKHKSSGKVYLTDYRTVPGCEKPTSSDLIHYKESCYPKLAVYRDGIIAKALNGTGPESPNLKTQENNNVVNNQPTNPTTISNNSSPNNLGLNFPTNSNSLQNLLGQILSPATYSSQQNPYLLDPIKNELEKIKNGNPNMKKNLNQVLNFRNQNNPNTNSENFQKLSQILIKLIESVKFAE